MPFRTATLAAAFAAATAAFAQVPAGEEKAPTTIDARSIEGVSDIE
jgi:hypothetical protein